MPYFKKPMKSKWSNLKPIFIAISDIDVKDSVYQIMKQPNMESRQAMLSKVYKDVDKYCKYNNFKACDIGDFGNNTKKIKKLRPLDNSYSVTSYKSPKRNVIK